jgi:protein gp37
MGNKTNIAWTDATWNVARGCVKVDEDCRACYMYRDSFDGTRYDPRQVIKTKTVFDMPMKYKNTKSEVWDGPPLIFTSSLTDVFLPEIDAYRHEIWNIIRNCPHLTFQILTKRPERIKSCLPPDWGSGWDHVWLGTSVGSQNSVKRIKYLEDVPAKTRFVSFEPLHNRIHSDFVSREIHWIIIGGESGHDSGKYRFRPMELEWVEYIIACYRQGSPNTAIFVKQLGTYQAKNWKFKDRHAGDITEWPKNLQIREFPTASTDNPHGLPF